MALLGNRQGFFMRQTNRQQGARLETRLDTLPMNDLT